MTSPRKARASVLFVCVHNAGRSQMAEALFNHLAGPGALARSAGTMPAAAVHPIVVEAMRDLGLDLSSRQPKLLTEEMVRQAGRVITMGCSIEETCPAALVDSEDWGIEDPAGKPLETVRRIRDQIRGRVEQLLADLAAPF